MEDKEITMHISECEEAAKNMECENPKFTIVGPAGEKEAEWLDPWMGIFKFEGAEGFSMTSDLHGLPVTCANLRCEVPAPRKPLIMIVGDMAYDD